jgi:uncharacterized damage-inducible protein DinB
MKEHILKYLQYNFWANKKVVEYLQSKAPEDLEVDIPGSFPSLKKTLLHIWDAEVLWYFRLKGVSLPDFPSKQFVGYQNELFGGLLEASENFIQLCKAQEDSFFQSKHTYLTLSYGETTQTAADMLHHCMNHSTFHRGQLIMMMRQLGYTDPPHLDYMLYLITLNTAGDEK